MIRFVSLAALTQVVSALAQLLLLPLQMRYWGAEATAAWYAGLAFAYLATATDLGLRTAGHADLVAMLRQPGDLAAATRFATLWGWIRVLVGLGTIGIGVADQGVALLVPTHQVPLWRSLLVAGFGLETLLIIRCGYLDSCGLYVRAEASYLAFALLRLVAAIGLVLLGAQAEQLGWLYAAAALLGLALQGALGRKVAPLRLSAGVALPLPLRALGVVRHTLAEPATAWARFSLPVLVLAGIAGPEVTALYVGLRAVFGLARTTTLQLGRFVSVRYLERLRADEKAAGARLLANGMALCSALAAALGFAVLADNGRLVGAWLGSHVGDDGFWVGASFAVAAPYFAHQLVQATMMRSGDVPGVARRQYAFLALNLAAALLGVATGEVIVYLAAVALAEILVAALFMLVGGAATRGFAGATVWGLVLAMLYLPTRL